MLLWWEPAFAGLYTLYRLRAQGLSVKFSKRATTSAEPGTGTGIPAPDANVESMDYSYSFDPDLEQEWEWTEKYAGQPEILSYIRHVADRTTCART
jgi:cation diffusion facilitator CzcD-associated flavoprotein CzcO